MTSTVTPQITRAFSCKKWEISESKYPSALLQWDEDPWPVDAEVPLRLKDALSTSLLQRGTILFGDNPKEPDNSVMGRMRLRSLAKPSCLVQATDASAARRAFDASEHHWYMGLQWIFSVDLNTASHNDIVEFATEVYRDWTVPSVWPDYLRVLIEAGVDGCAAGIFCRTEEDLTTFTTELIASFEASA